MDFLLELLVQAFVQIVVELIGELLVQLGKHSLRLLVTSATARQALGFAAGLGLGWLWGAHLAGNETWPKLFWVSVALAAAAFVAAMTRSDSPRSEAAPAWRALVVPPWRWDAERLVGFALMNVGIAFGIAFAFGPSWTPTA